MTDRRKTALILGMTSLFMFIPLAMSLFWHPIPLFQNLGFERESIAPPLAWILATITAIAYVLYTMRAIPFIAGIQREISLFKLLGILLAIIYLVGGRNLGPCIYAHVIKNIIIEPWLMLSAVSGKQRV
jgi:hypothetical protein